AGLVLFGPKLIRTVGERITKLDRARAFCVALSAAITVIIASTLGLPVSSTHIAVGGVFGVGFLREYLSRRKRREAAIVMKASEDASEQAPTSAMDWEKQKKKLVKLRGRKLVRRQHLITIIAAWLITVPLAALLAALLYFLIHFFIPA
ncbi:MAG: inorganic phosphate transporter, partial [Rhodospirillales bacterium]